MRSFTLALVVAAISSSTVAHADDACRCAAAACRALAAAGGAVNCAELSGVPSAACGEVATSIANGLRSMERPVPDVCRGIVRGDVPATAPQSGTTGRTGSAIPARAPVPEEAPPMPTPLPPDTPSLVRAGGTSRLACVMDRDGSRRVMVAGSTGGFVVRCIGIPTRANPRGAGDPVEPPTRTKTGAPVNIRWGLGVPGSLTPLHARASYQAPATVPTPAEIRITATVTVGAESVTLVRTVHLVPRALRLEVASRTLIRCVEIRPGVATINTGYDIECDMTIDLSVADDLTVTSDHGRSCGVGTRVSTELCVPQIEIRAEAAPGWSLDSANGRIDPDTGVLTLDVEGNRVDMPITYYRDGHASEAHTAPLFAVPLDLSVEDGFSRRFGSLARRPDGGETISFTLRAR